MIIAGIDEAGRGPAVGPMVMAVAVIEKDNEEELREIGVKDSKLLSIAARERQFGQIRNMLIEHRTVHISAKEIDELRIRKSLNEIEAMRAAHLLNNLKVKPSVVFIDSPDPKSSTFADRIRKYLSFNCILKAEHKADINYPIVSAASILAKVERDLKIRKLEDELGVKIGTGYSHDEDTITFIKSWLEKNNSLHECVRKSWATSIRLQDERLQSKLGQW